MDWRSVSPQTGNGSERKTEERIYAFVVVDVVQDVPKVYIPTLHNININMRVLKEIIYIQNCLLYIALGLYLSVLFVFVQHILRHVLVNYSTCVFLC